MHGTWSNPDDWWLVTELLVQRGVRVTAPDLPSQRMPSAGLRADADEVRRAIRSSTPPVVVAGWSYGGSVISIAADGEPSVVRLVYVADVPSPENDGYGSAWRDASPHVAVRDDGTHLLDNDWWLDEEVGTTFPSHVRDHLRRHPRRPASVRQDSEAQTAAAWRSIPTTCMLGRHDELQPEDRQQWALQHLSDVRLVDCDHFILFRAPQVVADVVLEALGLETV